MEVSGELHALAVLPPGNRSRYPMDKRLGGPESRSGRSGEELRNNNGRTPLAQWATKPSSCKGADSEGRHQDERSESFLKDVSSLVCFSACQEEPTFIAVFHCPVLVVHPCLKHYTVKGFLGVVLTIIAIFSHVIVTTNRIWAAGLNYV
jgi:hypothetical protein